MPPYTVRTIQTDEDVDRVAAFCSEIHSYKEGPDTRLGDLVRDLCSPRHPSATRDDFWFIEGPDGEILASMCLIPQVWRYEEVTFPVGRMELVGTRAEYRQQGLMRLLNEAFEARCQALGMNVLSITGIFYLYRRLGYEYALNLNGGREIPFALLPQKAPEDSPYTLRPAEARDIPALAALYERCTAALAVSQVRSTDEWAYRIYNHIPNNVGVLRYTVIEQDGTPIGYAGITQDCAPNHLTLNELAIEAPMPQVVPWLLPTLRDTMVAVTADDDYWELDTLVFRTGETHPIYPYLAPYKPHSLRTYAWYIRVMDIAAFLHTIRPVLERRLAQSPAAGLTLDLSLRMYTQQLTLSFKEGALTEVHSGPSDIEAGSASIHEMPFLQLLFGYRSFDELAHLQPDVFARPSVKPILDVLFPKRPSWTTALD